jgi:hypothetical protein
MTTLATRTEQSPAIDDDTEFTLTHPPLGTIAPGEPAYLIPDNPWLPWVNRSGGFALGAIGATITSALRESPYLWWAFATTIATTLLFAWFLAAHELYEKRPTKFKALP